MLRRMRYSSEPMLILNGGLLSTDAETNLLDPAAGDWKTPKKRCVLFSVLAFASLTAAALLIVLILNEHLLGTRYQIPGLVCALLGMVACVKSIKNALTARDEWRGAARTAKAKPVRAVEVVDQSDPYWRLLIEYAGSHHPRLFSSVIMRAESRYDSGRLLEAILCTEFRSTELLRLQYKTLLKDSMPTDTVQQELSRRLPLLFGELQKVEDEHNAHKERWKTYMDSRTNAKAAFHIASEGTTAAIHATPPVFCIAKR